MIKLRQKVRDKITGFEGITTARIEYDNGCIQFCVKPKMTEPGKMPEGQYIDVEQLVFIKEGETIDSRPGGGERQDKPKANYSG